MAASPLISARRFRSLGGGKSTDAMNPYRHEALHDANPDNAVADGHNVVR